MSDFVSIEVQGTPNPHAKKFVIDRTLKRTGKISYRRPDECAHVPLALNLFDIEGVKQLHFFENVLTVSKSLAQRWVEVEPTVVAALKSLVPEHNPEFSEDTPIDKSHYSEDMHAIDKVLDEDIRPFLQADGGDVEIVDYEQNILTVKYQGACGNCPSSQAGTLHAIVTLLREQINPQIEVVAL